TDHLIDGRHVLGNQALDRLKGGGSGHGRKLHGRGETRIPLTCVPAGGDLRPVRGLTGSASACILHSFPKSPGAGRQEITAMYAVVKTGGKQYRVSAGEKLKVESIRAEVGAHIVLDQVLLVADGDKVTTGTPLVSGATVKATVVAHGRGEKVA